MSIFTLVDNIKINRVEMDGMGSNDRLLWTRHRTSEFPFAENVFTMERLKTRHILFTVYASCRPFL